MYLLVGATNPAADSSGALIASAARVLINWNAANVAFFCSAVTTAAPAL